MKKLLTMFISLALILVLSLAACGANGLEQAAVIDVNTEQNAPGYVEGEDYQIQASMWANHYAARFTKGENGYYYNIFGPASPLMFYDVNSGIAVPVCNRPNCSHTAENCNASLGFLTGVEFIQYYDGNLYAFGYEGMDISKANLYWVSTDGATRGKLGTLYNFVGDNTGYDALIHRGYAYATLYNGGTDKRTVEVHRLSLSGDGEAETIYTFEDSYGGSASIKA